MSDFLYKVRGQRRLRKTGLTRRLARRPDKSRPRLVVRVSHKHIRAQIIDDSTNKTLAVVSTEKREFGQTDKGVDKARIVGVEIGKKAKEVGISKVVLDKGSKIYHGKIKAVAEAARKEGLIF